MGVKNFILEIHKFTIVKYFIPSNYAILQQEETFLLLVDDQFRSVKLHY